MSLEPGFAGRGGRESTGERKRRVVYCMERVRRVQYSYIQHACMPRGAIDASNRVATLS